MSSFFQILLYIVAGVFILLFFLVWIWLLWKFILKPMGFGKWFARKWKNMRLNRQKKKLLEDEELLKYCVKRIEAGWKEIDVRKELFLSNKYDDWRIEQVAYIFNIIKKELINQENDE